MYTVCLYTVCRPHTRSTLKSASTVYCLVPSFPTHTKMILLPPDLCLFDIPKISSSNSSGNAKAAAKSATSENGLSFRCSQTVDDVERSKKNTEVNEAAACNSRFCSCVTRRHLLGTMTSSCAFLPIGPSFGSDPLPNDPLAVLNKIHPPRPEWYEELYASILENGMRAYEEEISGYKSQLFSSLRGTSANKVLEIGIGTGPNLKYYAHEAGVHIFGVDPNRKMEKYAQKAAYNAGVPPSNFTFVQAVVEALPLSDASVDAVIGTLVLCSVNDVDLAVNEVMRVLKPGGLYVFVEHVASEDGTIRRYIQGILDPLQQIVADGCHLTRQTGKFIAQAGFSSVDIQQAFLSSASIINPHVYGIAQK